MNDLSAQPAAATAARKWNPWPWAIIGYFATVLTIMGFFVPFALRQNMDLVRPDYYEAEALHQAQMLRVERTRPLLGEIELALLPEERKLRLRIPAGQAATAEGSVQLYRPSDARRDATLPLAVDGGGVQWIDTAEMIPGLWRARVSWSWGGGEYYFEQAVVVPPRS